MRHGTLAKASRQVVYYPHAQLPGAGMELVVRSAGGPAAVTNAVRETIRRLDPDLPVDSIRPLNDIVQRSLFNQELELGLLGTFALLAVVLAAAGIYGVMTYAIAQRRAGVRYPARARRHRRGHRPSRRRLRRFASPESASCWDWRAPGLVRLCCDLLYGIKPTDPVVFASTTALLAAIALSACVIPARRALRVDPITALRSE